MLRTQIQLEPEQVRAVKSLSKSAGVSMSAVIRQCIEIGIPKLRVNRKQSYSDAAALIGIGKDSLGKRNISVNHDAHAWSDL